MMYGMVGMIWEIFPFELTENWSKERMQSTVWTNLPHAVAFIGMDAALHDNDVNAT